MKIRALPGAHDGGFGSAVKEKQRTVGICGHTLPRWAVLTERLRTDLSDVFVDHPGIPVLARSLKAVRRRPWRLAAGRGGLVVFNRVAVRVEGGRVRRVPERRRNPHVGHRDQ
jgi:hypothetical protein